MDTSIKSSEDSLKSMDVTCNLQCGIVTQTCPRDYPFKFAAGCPIGSWNTKAGKGCYKQQSEVDDCSGASGSWCVFSAYKNDGTPMNGGSLKEQLEQGFGSVCTSSGELPGSSTCTEAELTTLSECTKSVTENADTSMSDKSKMCPLYQSMFACYPACYCDDPNMKAAMDTSIKSSEDSLKSMDVTCNLQCGIVAQTITQCSTSDKAALDASCKCASASTTNECAKDQYCYIDNTCNNNPKPVICPSSDTVALAAKDNECICKGVLCAVGSFCWTDTTCNAIARQAKVFVLSLETKLTGVEPSSFNSNVKMITAFKATVANLLDGINVADVYDVFATAFGSDNGERRRLASASVSYKVKAKSIDAATQVKTEMTSNNDKFTTVLKQEMVKEAVEGFETNNIEATTDTSAIKVEESSEKEINSNIEKSKDGDLNEQNQLNNDNNPNSDVNNNNKEEESNVGGVIGYSLGGFIFLSLVGWVLYVKLVTNKQSNQSDIFGQNNENNRSAYFENPGAKRSSIENKFVDLELTDLHVVNDIEHELPKLHLLLDEINLRSFLNQFIMFGFYNTSHLIDDMKEEDLTQMGMRTLQRRKLLLKIEALKTGMMSDNVFEETAKEIEINSQPKKKNWKRRFSVASNMEYFENLESGKTQWSAPEAFGGVDEPEKTDETSTNLENPLTKEQNVKTTADKLQEAKLNTYINQIENVFDNDLNAITHEWMNANMKTIHIRRLKTLIAKENGCLWYSGTTADYNWWMNATNDEVLYFPPTGTTDVVLPVPKTYFDEDSAKKAENQTPVTRSKKNWKIASAKMRTVNAFSKKNIRPKLILG